MDKIGKEFTDSLIARRERQAMSNHAFDQLCQALNIDHRLTKPHTPQTNGMVERFNGRHCPCAQNPSFHQL